MGAMRRKSSESEIRFVIHGTAAAQKTEEPSEVISQGTMQRATMMGDGARSALGLQATTSYIPDKGTIE